MSFPSQIIRLATDFRGIPRTEGMEQIRGREPSTTPPLIELPRLELRDEAVKFIELKIMLDSDEAYWCTERSQGIVERDGKIIEIGGIGLVRNILAKPVFAIKPIDLSGGKPIRDAITSSVDDQATAVKESLNNDQLASDYPGFVEFGKHLYSTYVAFYAKATARQQEVWARLHFTDPKQKPPFVTEARKLSGSDSSRQEFYEHTRLYASIDFSGN